MICIKWDDAFAQDRFFGYIDPAMIAAVVAAAGDGEFAEENDPGAFIRVQRSAINRPSTTTPMSNSHFTKTRQI